MAELGSWPIATKSALTGIVWVSPVFMFLTRTASVFFSPSISSVSVFQYILILAVFCTRSCITLDALISSRLTNMCTVEQSLER